MSLADVARETGVSISAVSLALREHASIPLKTRRRIQEAAKLLGYRPNPMLASLASDHFRASEKESGIPVAYLRYRGCMDDVGYAGTSLLKEGQQHGRKLGYRMEGFDVEDYKNGGHLSRVLFARGMQGIVLAGSFPPALLEGIDWKSFSGVAMGEGLADSDGSPLPFLNRASVDHFGVVVRAWTETQKRGHQRIGFIFFTHAPPLADDEARLGAADACQRRLPARQQIPSLILSRTDTVSQVRKWVQQYRPEVIIGLNNWILWNILEAGYRVPEEIKFVSLNTYKGDKPGERSSANQNAGMKEMIIEQMLAAVELMDQQIRHHHYGLDAKARTLLIHSEWIDGDTLTLPAKSASK